MKIYTLFFYQITITLILLFITPQTTAMISLQEQKKQLTCGSSPNKVNKYFETKKQHENLLFSAAVENNLHTVQFLIGIGTNINVQSAPSQESPLHYAAYHGNVEIGKFLIHNKAEINIQNKNKQTPLHYAIHRLCSINDSTENYNKFVEFITLLLNNGAQVRIQDSHDCRPDSHVVNIPKEEHFLTPQNEYDQKFHQEIMQQCILEEQSYRPSSFPIERVLFSSNNFPVNKQKRACINRVHALLLLALYKEKHAPIDSTETLMCCNFNNTL